MTIVRLVALWSAVSAGVLFALALVGVPEKLVISAGTGMLFAAIAHISKSPYWQYLKSKELNPLSKSYGISSVPKPELAAEEAIKLDTPIKRIWFLVFLLGGIVSCITFAIFEMRYSYLSFLDAMFNRPDGFQVYRAFMLGGVLLSTLGYAFAFQYERTLGKIIQWIKSGSPHS